jgi:hypothetical protein
LLPPRIALSSFPLSKIQKQRLAQLQTISATSYDPQDEDHQRQLYNFGISVFGEKFADSDDGNWKSNLISEKWKKIGFQGSNPATDFRGGGLLSLSNLHYLVQTEPRIFKRLCRSQDGSPEHYLPFAITGINITFMLMQLLQIRTHRHIKLSPDEVDVYVGFCGLLETEQYAFEEIYKACFQYLEELWTDNHAKWMDFQEMMQIVKEHISDILARNPFNIAEFHQFMAEEPTLLPGVKALS